MGQAAVGDVRVREERHNRSTRTGLEHGIDAAAFGQLVGVGELHSLRWPGRSGGVDQGQHVVAGHGPPCGVEIEPGPRLGGVEVVERQCTVGGRVDDDQVLDGAAERDRRPDAIQERRLGHEHAVTGICEQVRDLLRRRGVVDRERGGPEVHRRGVDEVELRTVGQDEADSVTPPDAERVKRPGVAPDPLGILGKRDRDAVGDRAQRDLVGPVGRGELKRLAHRACVQRRRPPRRPRLDRTLHRAEILSPGPLYFKPLGEPRSFGASGYRPIRASRSAKLTPTA